MPEFNTQLEVTLDTLIGLDFAIANLKGWIAMDYDEFCRYSGHKLSFTDWINCIEEHKRSVKALTMLASSVAETLGVLEQWRLTQINQ